MKTKKKYEKPQMEVFELQHQPQILAGSGKRSPYGDPIPGNWG